MERFIEVKSQNSKKASLLIEAVCRSMAGHAEIYNALVNLFFNFDF
jgi:hypothetical protein